MIRVKYTERDESQEYSINYRKHIDELMDKMATLSDLSECTIGISIYCNTITLSIEDIYSHDYINYQYDDDNTAHDIFYQLNKLHNLDAYGDVEFDTGISFY